MSFFNSPGFSPEKPAYCGPRGAAIRGTGLALCVLVFLFAACTLDPERGNLHGDWKIGGYTSYTIDIAAKTVEYVGGYEANIVNNPDYTAASGVLIIQFITGEDVVYGTSWEVIDTIDISDKYSALYWNDLTPESVKFADPWVSKADDSTPDNPNDDMEHVVFDSLAEAEAAFTMEKVTDYIASWDVVKTPYNK